MRTAPWCRIPNISPLPVAWTSVTVAFPKYPEQLNCTEPLMGTDRIVANYTKNKNYSLPTMPLVEFKNGSQRLQKGLAVGGHALRSKLQNAKTTTCKDCKQQSAATCKDRKNENHCKMQTANRCKLQTARGRFQVCLCQTSGFCVAVAFCKKLGTC